MSTTSAFRTMMKRVHADERGSLSLETVLILGAIALPILVFTIKFGWPKIKDYFFDGVRNLENETQRVTSGQQ